MAHVRGYGKDGGPAVEGLADDAGEEPGCRQIGLARPHADSRQANGDAIHEPAPGVVGQKQLRDRLLGSVARGGRRAVLVADHLRERRPEDRYRRAEDEPRPVAGGRRARRFKQAAGRVEIHPVALLEVGLGLAGDDRRQVEHDIWEPGQQILGDPRLGDVGHERFDARIARRNRRHRGRVGEQEV